MSVKSLDLPCNLDTSFTFVAFFAVGNKIHDLHLLERFNTLQCCLLSLSGYLLFCILPVKCYASVNRYDSDNVAELFIMLLVLSLSIVLFCKTLSSFKWKWLTIFSYAGKHSLWILCSHHLIYRPIKFLCSFILDSHSNLCAYIVFSVTICICLFSASYMEKRIPWALGK